MSESRPSYDELLDTNQHLQRQVEVLQAENARLQSLREQSQRAGKRQAAPFRKGPPKSDPKTPGRKSGDAHGSHGHRPLPPPDHIGEILDAALPELCPGCGGSLVEDEIRHQYQTEIPRQPLHRQFNVPVGHCMRCGQRVQGRHPLQTSDALGAAASQVGPDGQAAIATLNNQAGLSHGKIVACLDSLFGIDLSRGASVQIVLRAGQRLEPAYQEIRQATQQAERLVVDETGWRLEGQPAWLHVWVSERATCYAIDSHRRADALEEVLGLDWEGTLVHDGFASYDRFTSASHQQCLAQVLRRAREMLEDARGGAVRFPGQVIGLFTEAIHLHNEYRAGRVTVALWERARDVFDDRLLVLVNRARSVPASATLSDHWCHHFASWFSFLSDAQLPATNWAAEQAIRPAVVNRKVWGGNRTVAGASAQGIVTSVLETCQKQALSALDFVSQSLRAFGNTLLPRPVLLGTR